SAHGSLRMLTFSDGKVKTIVENSGCGRYLAGGYLVYSQRATLFAAPMDPDRLKLTGPAVPLVDGGSNAGEFDAGQFDVSNSGTLVYRSDSAGTSFLVSWLYPSGKTESLFPKDSYSTPHLSPDGSRLAIPLIKAGEQRLWVYDF